MLIRPQSCLLLIAMERESRCIRCREPRDHPEKPLCPKCRRRRFEVAKAGHWVFSPDS